MPVVLTTHPLHPDAHAALEGAADIRVASSLSADTLTDEARGTAAIIVRAPIPEAVFYNRPELRAAVRHGAGVDMIPVAAATKAGVLVANVPGVNARSVAEHVMFCTLSLSRRFRSLDQALRSDGWLAGRAFAEGGQEIDGRVMGVIGLGNVGGQIAGLAHALGMQVLGHSPNPKRGHGLPLTLAGIDTVLAKSDFVALACPLTDQTRGLIDRRSFALMKNSAYLINVSRGAVVNETDLIEALATDQIAGGALDVFAEQPLASDHPLLQFSNVLITPHLAGITEQSMRRMGLGAAAEVLRILKGEPPVNLINPAALPMFEDKFRGKPAA